VSEQRAGSETPAGGAGTPAIVPGRLRGRLRALIGWASIAAGTAGSRGLSVLASVIVARELGPGGFGDFSIFFALLIVFSMATRFVDVTYVRYASVASASSRAILRATLLMKLAITAVFVALAYPLARVLAQFLYDRDDLTGPIVLAIVAGLAVGLVAFRASTFLAERRYVAYSLVGSLFYVATIVALLPTWIGGVELHATTVYWIFLGAALAVGLPALATLVASAWPLEPDWSVVSNVVRFATWLFAANLVTVVLLRLDVILLAAYVDKVEVGLYGAALRIVMVIGLLIGAMSGFFLPRVGETRSSRAALRKYLRDARFFVVVLGFAIVATWLAAPLLMRGVFGSEFSDATSLVRIILLGTLFMAISAPLGQLLLGGEVPRGIVFLNLTRLGAILGLIVLLAPRFGATGVAWAYVGSELAAVVYVAVAAVVIWRNTPEGS
jgi:O-antigen/teichoic acid export membrane protein